jgi:Fe-S-cluster-containing hydrogenase component 2
MPNLAAATKCLVVTPTRCTACRTCELACSFRHGTPNRPAPARIRAFDLGGVPDNVVVTCFQCDDAACVRVCPTQALVRDERTGAVVVLEARCIACGSCAVACPFGQIEMDPARKVAAKCDLCGGDPACAAFCPTKALEYR